MHGSAFFSTLRSRGTGRRDGEAGFTLIEALVSLVIMIAVLVGVLTLFDRSNQVARSQTHLAEMQQALRMGQYEMVRAVRMAGRGGIPAGVVPAGLAVAVRNNAPTSGDGSTIAFGDAGSPKVLPGSDVLTIRGAIQAPIYQVNPLGGTYVLDDPDAPTMGSIRVRNPHETTGVAQDLTPLIEAVTTGSNEALLLVSPVDVWSVVEIDPTTSDVTSDPNDLLIGFNVGTLTGTAIVDRYVQLGGGFPSTLRTVSSLALLEEYRYYIREERAYDGDDNSDLVPRLVKARFHPNTEVPHPDDPVFGAEVSDNILDLQVTLGADTDGNGLIDEGGDDVALAKEDDDWLFNTPEDSDGSGNPAEPEKWNPLGGVVPLFYVRLTTTARSDRREIGYQAPVLGLVQDKDFSVTPHSIYNTTNELRFRRRSLETVVDLRNL